MNTILGANGIIAHELSRALSSVNTDIRQVSRNPQKEHETDELVRADLLDATATADAVAGSDVVYLVAGLPYSAASWKDQWPRVMRNTIDACKRHQAKLVFLDNVYAYGLVKGAMKEDTPFNPNSIKGEVRAKISTMLLDEMRAGDLQAMIVRAADFYGPGAVLSYAHIVLFERLMTKKTPQWMGNANAVHTFTYTPDAGSALALLGQTPTAYGQTWHLPTTKELLTGSDIVRLACELKGQPYKLQVAPRWLLKIMGLFNPVLRENDEMMYQFEYDYRFDSSKIERVFGVKPTSYREGIKRTLSALQ